MSPWLKAIVVTSSTFRFVAWPIPGSELTCSPGATGLVAMPRFCSSKSSKARAESLHAELTDLRAALKGVSR